MLGGICKGLMVKKNCTRLWQGKTLKQKRIYLFMLFTAVCLSIKYIFMDFGVDAEFQISMSYRLAQGDRMFTEMWEAHQMSTFLPALFIKVYLTLFHTTTGIVLYLQAIGTLLDWGIACLLYRTVNKYLRCPGTAFAMAWLFVVVSPKDVPLPEFANMQIWSCMLLCLALFLYEETGRKALLFLAALSLCSAVLSYPSCLILTAGVGILFFTRGRKKDFVLFLAICAVLGIGYLYLTMRQISAEDFAIFFKNMLALETPHSGGLAKKFAAYLPDAAKTAMLLAAACGLAHLSVWTAVRITGRKRYSSGKPEWDRETCQVLTDMLFFIFITAVSLYTVIFWNMYTRYAYSLSFLSVIIIGAHYSKKLSGYKRYFYVCENIISFLGFLSTLLLTDLQLIGSIPYLLIAVTAAFLPIGEIFGGADGKKWFRMLKRKVVLCGVVFLIFRNIYLIRPMYLQADTILQLGGIVKEGPAIGIVSSYMGPYMQNESVREWREYVEEGSTIWLVGSPLDTLGYLYLNTEIGAPSTVCTPSYNESVLEYWKMNPDKYPDVVIASCWYGNLNAELQENDWIMQWLNEDFRPTYVVDGKFWRYYLKKPPENPSQSYSQ